MGKLRASVGGLEMMPEMGHSQPRLGPQNGSSSEDDILSMIFPDFEENLVQPMGLKMAPLLRANHGRGLPQLWVN